LKSESVVEGKGNKSLLVFLRIFLNTRLEWKFNQL